MTPSEERSQWLSKKPNYQLSKILKTVAWIVTVLVLILVGLMRQPDLRIPLPEGVSLNFLPATHAMINSLVAAVLIMALFAVKLGKIGLHKKLILGAMGLSTIFLLGYVVYHFTNIETLFGDINHDGDLNIDELKAVGTMRPVYMVLLISHIMAAAISLPLILLTFIAAWTNRFNDHRSMARWVFPIWLYVAVTGPICYLMLRPYY
ncbi:MAG: DUF420 domain-containing protein [Armatimonadetes bacterium]|nr:DUF420 domain-containing protein [Akkermansiaceae bacterium]